jgi:hypothetical protein
MRQVFDLFFYLRLISLDRAEYVRFKVTVIPYNLFTLSQVLARPAAIWNVVLLFLTMGSKFR